MPLPPVITATRSDGTKEKKHQNFSWEKDLEHFVLPAGFLAISPHSPLPLSVV